MALKLKRKMVERIPPLDGGSYMAICIGVIDCGEQYNETFKNYSDKVLLLFEIQGETVHVDGKQEPRWLSKEYTASLSEKAKLVKDVTSWRARPFTEDEMSEDGSGFDLTSLGGMPCMLTVIVRSGKNGDYNQIENISPVPKGIPAPTTDQDILIFDIDDRNEAVFDALPEWIQTKIRKSTQYAQNPPDQPTDIPEEEKEEECPI